MSHGACALLQIIVQEEEKTETLSAARPTLRIP